MPYPYLHDTCFEMRHAVVGELAVRSNPVQINILTALVDGWISVELG